MRTWTTERSSPTTMEPSRWVLTWNCHQTVSTTVCFSSLVWRTTSSPDWTKQWSGATQVRLRPEARTTKRVQHTQGIFSLSGLTNPNKRVPAKLSYEGGYQLGKSTQGFSIWLWARSRERGGVCSIWPITDMDKSTVSRQTDRAAHITKEEQTILDKYEEVKHLIQTKSNTVEAAKCRKDSWQKKKLPMCECVN